MSPPTDRREVIVVDGGQAGLAIGYLLAQQGRDFTILRTVRRGDDGYRVALDGRTCEAEQVVVATGPFQIPRVPPHADRLDPSIVQFHSAEYRTPDAIPDGAVLVVGGGNSGFQIAEELSRSHDVHLSIGARQIPLPQRILGRDLFRYLEATRLMSKTVESRIGQRMQHRETIIGSSPRKARRRHRITLHGRTVDASGSEVTVDDGATLAPGRSSGPPASDPTTPGSSYPYSTSAGASSTNAASPPRPASTSSDCPGSTREAPRCSDGSSTTLSTWRSRSPRSREPDPRGDRPEPRRRT
jgi:cation diffusion facilitator CzcD-associated flavoprotein CzcO